MLVSACAGGIVALCAAACGHGATQAAAPAAHQAVGNQGHGAAVYRANCAVCHSPTGAAAGVGPSLRNEKQRKSFEQTVAWIENPDPPMPKLMPSPLSEKDVADVAAYVQSL